MELKTHTRHGDCCPETECVHPWKKTHFVCIVYNAAQRRRVKATAVCSPLFKGTTHTRSLCRCMTRQEGRRLERRDLNSKVLIYKPNFPTHLWVTG